MNVLTAGVEHLSTQTDVVLVTAKMDSSHMATNVNKQDALPKDAMHVTRVSAFIANMDMILLTERAHHVENKIVTISTCYIYQPVTRRVSDTILASVTVTPHTESMKANVESAARDVNTVLLIALADHTVNLVKKTTCQLMICHIYAPSFKMSPSRLDMS